jgi:hypothetical protein
MPPKGPLPPNTFPFLCLKGIDYIHLHQLFAGITREWNLQIIRLMTALCVVVAFGAASLPAKAEMRKMDGMIALSVPGESWALTMPEQDWALAQQRDKPDGTGVFYYLVSNSQSLNFSVFLDKTTDCNSAPSCRDRFWKSPHPQYKDALDIRHFDRNGFAVSTFHFDRIMNMPAFQTNVGAHAYRNGYWIDVNISKVGGKTPPLEPLLKVIDSLKLE